MLSEDDRAGDGRIRGEESGDAVVDVVGAEGDSRRFQIVMHVRREIWTLRWAEEDVVKADVESDLFTLSAGNDAERGSTHSNFVRFENALNRDVGMSDSSRPSQEVATLDDDVWRSVRVGSGRENRSIGDPTEMELLLDLEE